MECPTFLGWSNNLNWARCGQGEEFFFFLPLQTEYIFYCPKYCDAVDYCVHMHDQTTPQKSVTYTPDTVWQCVTETVPRCKEWMVF